MVGVVVGFDGGSGGWTACLMRRRVRGDIGAWNAGFNFGVVFVSCLFGCMG